MNIRAQDTVLLFRKLERLRGRVRRLTSWAPTVGCRACIRGKTVKPASAWCLYTIYHRVQHDQIAGTSLQLLLPLVIGDERNAHVNSVGDGNNAKDWDNPQPRFWMFRFKHLE